LPGNLCEQIAGRGLEVHVTHAAAAGAACNKKVTAAAATVSSIVMKSVIVALRAGPKNAPEAPQTVAGFG